MSELGFGPWRKANEDFLGTFETSYEHYEQRIGAPSTINMARGARYDTGACLGGCTFVLQMVCCMKRLPALPSTRRAARATTQVHATEVASLYHMAIEHFRGILGDVPCNYGRQPRRQHGAWHALRHRVMLAVSCGTHGMRRG